MYGTELIELSIPALEERRGYGGEGASKHGVVLRSCGDKGLKVPHLKFLG